MAKLVVEVRDCDRCGKQPANTWTITGPEGAVCEIDLCEHHGAPVANAYALGRSVSTRPTRRAPRRRSTGQSSHAPALTAPALTAPALTAPALTAPALTAPVRPEPQWR